MAGSPELINELHERLADDEDLLLWQIVAVAEDRKVHAYAVGGAARDLLLGVESLDLDIAIDGDALDVARSAAERTGARVVKTTRFGTASLKLGAASVDVATSRKEHYSRPGALPDTDAGAIEDDLVRRDFTVNAIAIRLTGSAAGQVVDPADGRRDLRDRVIRVLHDGSLRDDPTRMIRAARYEQRLRFAIHADTEMLIRRDLHTLDSVSGTRLRQEVERTLREDRRAEILLRMHSLGVLRAIHPGLAFGTDQAAGMRRLREGAHDSMLARWAIVVWVTADDQIESLCARLAPSGRLRDVLRSLREARSAAREIDRAPSASAVAARLRGLPVPTVAALSCSAPNEVARDRALDYLQRMRNMRPLLSGNDLIALGLPEGPEIGRMLARLRDDRLDGVVTCREDELAIARSELGKRKVRVAT